MISEKPLSHILRPTSIDDFIGQEHLINKDALFRRMLDSNTLMSCIFYGPPGVGKTSLAYVISKECQYNFVTLNATSDGVKTFRDAIKNASKSKCKTVLFIDELEYANKSQQSVLLPAVEDGTIILITATVANPYFSLNGPLISRSKIFELKKHGPKEIVEAINKAVDYYRDNSIKIHIDLDAAKYLINTVDGDIRQAINAIWTVAENYVSGNKVDITLKLIKNAIPIKGFNYDAYGEEHYDALSGIQGAIQASDPDGAVFWLGWAINRGEKLEAIGRRIMVAAYEDVGLSDPTIATFAAQAVESAYKIGFPEAKLALSSAVIGLAMAKRSKASCMAISKAQELDQANSINVPGWLKDCHHEKTCKTFNRGSYKDGANMDEYKKFPLRIFKPWNGYENKLWKQNNDYWSKKKDRDKS